MSAGEADKPRRLFVQELPEGVPRPITPEGVFTEHAIATPDGAWVPAGSDYETAPYQLYPIDGGEPRSIPGLEKGDQPIRFSATAGGSSSATTGETRQGPTWRRSISPQVARNPGRS
jgi:hypothetical protein